MINKLINIVLAAILVFLGGHKTSGNYLLMPGSYHASTQALLLKINTDNWEAQNLVGDFKNLSYTGIHEARSFIVDNQKKIAMGTYFKGNLIIANLTDKGGIDVEYTDPLPDTERLRSIDTGDIFGDGNTEIVAGTRPSGFLKYYKYENGKWNGYEIDKAGAAIHDLLITDTDGDGRAEIWASLSTTDEADTANLKTIIPEVVKYTYSGNAWKKEVVWRPEKLVTEKGVYAHVRYLFTGDFDNDGTKEIVGGYIGGESGLQSLVTIKWDGKDYRVSSQIINRGLTLSADIIAPSEIDGKKQIVIPTLTGDAIFSFGKENGKWVRKSLISGLMGENNEGAEIIALSPIVSGGGTDKLLFVTSGNWEHPSDTIKLYTLTLDGKNSNWNASLKNTLKYPVADAWGMFPLQY